MRIGLEAEYWTIDDAGDLVPAGDLPEACDRVESEFVEPLVEIKTPPCGSIAELSEAFADGLARLLEAARERDKRLVPLGTPLADEQIPMRGGTRIDVQRAVLGDDFRHAAHCAGTHLHVEQTAVVDQLRALTALDPAFALVTTAPYYRGRRVAACARPLAYRRRCYRELPSHGRLWRYPDSAAEWRERRADRFEAFVAAAREAGVDRSTVEDAFTPMDAVWSPVRLRDDLGTVEWRAPDAAPPSAALRLAADVVEVVERAADRGTRIGTERGDDVVVVPPFGTLRERVDAAIAAGRSPPGVDEHLRQLGIDPSEYRPIGTRMDGREYLDAATARSLRRRYADRLEREVRRLRRGAAGEERAVAP